MAAPTSIGRLQGCQGLLGLRPRSCCARGRAMAWQVAGRDAAPDGQQVGLTFRASSWEQVARRAVGRVAVSAWSMEDCCFQAGHRKLQNRTRTGHRRMHAHSAVPLAAQSLQLACAAPNSRAVHGAEHSSLQGRTSSSMRGRVHRDQPESNNSSSHGQERISIALSSGDVPNAVKRCGRDVSRAGQQRALTFA